MSKRSAPPESTIWREGDLVEVMCTDDSVKVGIIVQVKHLVTCRLEGGSIYEGPGMTIHNVDEGLSSDGTILQWQRINKDELPADQYKSRLKRYDEKTADLSLYEKEVYRTISHCKNENDAGAYQLPTADMSSSLDRTLLDPANSNSLIRIVQSITKKASFSKICDTVGAEMNVVTAIASLLGRIVSSELSKWNGDQRTSASTGRWSKGMPNKERGKVILNQLKQSVENPFERLRAFGVPVLSVFLTTVATCNFKPNAPPHQGAFWPCLLLDRSKLSQAVKRVGKSVGALSLMHTSTGNDQRLTGPGFDSIGRGFKLDFVAKGGTSDSTLASLSKDGLTPRWPSDSR